MGTGMEENRIRQIKAVVTWTVLWMAVLALLSMVCVGSSGLLPAEMSGSGSGSTRRPSCWLDVFYRRLSLSFEGIL